MLTSCGLRGISTLSQLGCCGEVTPEGNPRLHVCVPARSHCSDRSKMLSLPGVAQSHDEVAVLKSSIPANAVKPLLVLLEVLMKRAPSCTDLLQAVI